jgi:hypothetical protein
MLDTLLIEKIVTFAGKSVIYKNDYLIENRLSVEI